MKKTLTLLLTIAILATSFTLQTKKKIIFFGDSITQAGVGKDGYITKMDSIIKVKGKNYDLIGAGLSGNKVYDLYMRLEDDVLAKNPDAVVIWIGVNDVWHKLYGTGTEEGTFRNFYTAIIKKLKDKGIAVYMCTPAAVGEKNDNSNDLDGGLNNYSNIIRQLAEKNNCPLIELRKAFLSYLATNNPENKSSGILTADGVHLNKAGNLFVAERMHEVLSKDFIK